MEDPIENLEAWQAFEEMRRAKGKRAPYTDLARKRIMFELRRFQADGQDIEEILWTSVTNGWSGVFLPRRLPAIHVPMPMASRKLLDQYEEHQKVSKPPPIGLLQALKAKIKSKGFL